MTKPFITAAQLVRIDQLAQNILNDHESDIQILCLEMAESHPEWEKISDSPNGEEDLEFLEALESVVMGRIAHKFLHGYFS